MTIQGSFINYVTIMVYKLFPDPAKEEMHAGIQIFSH